MSQNCHFYFSTKWGWQNSMEKPKPFKKAVFNIICLVRSFRNNTAKMYSLHQNRFGVIKKTQIHCLRNKFKISRDSKTINCLKKES